MRMRTLVLVLLISIFVTAFHSLGATGFNDEGKAEVAQDLSPPQSERQDLNEVEHSKERRKTMSDDQASSQKKGDPIGYRIVVGGSDSARIIIE